MQKTFVVLSSIALLLFPAHADAAAGPFTYRIDERLRPMQAQIVGLDRRPASAIGALADARGKTIEYVADEIVLQPRSPVELERVRAQYHAVVERKMAPRPRAVTAAEQGAALYLLRIAPNSVPMTTLADDMRFLGVSGAHRFSSPAAAQLVAAVAHLRRAGITAAVNLKMVPTAGGRFAVESGIPEDPDGAGGFTNWATQGAWADPPAGIGVGVIKAWDYLRYQAIPTCWLQLRSQCPAWSSPLLAIVDGGFALDETTGVSPVDNPDWPRGRPMQINTIDMLSASAGGTNPNLCSGGASCPWHGTAVFSAAAALPRNAFGAAGTSAELATLEFVKVRALSWDAGYAVYAAAFHAAVVNVSFGVSCPVDACGVIYDGANAFQLAILDGLSWNPLAVVVVAAGNETNAVNGKHDAVPCGLDFVICVGALNEAMGAEPFSNFGSKVAIWAPDFILTTPNPDTIALPAGTPGRLPNLRGTSFAAPFVSGIVVLMKTLDPNLTWGRVRSILQQTALPSPDLAVRPGYVNAYAAVAAVRPNLPPSIKITSPANAASIVGGAHFGATISDPEQAPYLDGMKLDWTADGNAMCPTRTSPFDCDALLATGTHKVVATLTDPYGATASDTITVSVTPAPVAAYITYPPDGTMISATQTIDFRGYGYSPVQLPLALDWTTNRQNGSLGTGTQIVRALPLGDNIVTLTASTAQGKGSASILVHVSAGTDVPSVHITSPADGAEIPLNTITSFSGAATDPVDGAVSGAALKWTDSIDGVLGSGTPFGKVLTGGACAPLVHHVTLTATNRAGKSAATTVTVSVGAIC